VGEHQQLGLGVERRALIRAAEPGPADLDPAVRAVDVCKARTADRAAGGAVDRREGDRRAGAAQGERRRDVRLKVRRRVDL